MEETKRRSAVLGNHEPAIREFLGTVLRSVGFDVLGEAENGKQAIEAFVKNKPDFTFLDVDLPVVDGATVLKALKGKFPRAHFIMLVTHDNEIKGEDCLSLGASDILRKDLSVRDMKLSLLKILQR